MEIEEICDGNDVIVDGEKLSIEEIVYQKQMVDLKNTESLFDCVKNLGTTSVISKDPNEFDSLVLYRVKEGTQKAPFSDEKEKNTSKLIEILNVWK